MDYTAKVAAISIDQNSSYSNGNVDVVISGGTIAATKDAPAVSFTVHGKAPTGNELDGTKGSRIIVTGSYFSDRSPEPYLTADKTMVDDVAPDYADMYTPGGKYYTVTFDSTGGSATARGQMMTILARIAGVDTEGGFPWYAKGMAWAVENGVSDGSDPEMQRSPASGSRRCCGASLARPMPMSRLFRRSRTRLPSPTGLRPPWPGPSKTVSFRAATAN